MLPMDVYCSVLATIWLYLFRRDEQLSAFAGCTAVAMARELIAIITAFKKEDLTRKDKDPELIFAIKAINIWSRLVNRL